jgi:tryptophan synthase alpha chain
MNRINETLSKYDKAANKDKLLSIYFTAGFPELEDTRAVLKGLQKAGVDMI